MDDLPALQRNRHWRTAVWALRVGYLALAVAITGLVVLSTGATAWVLAAGVIGWFVAAVVTATGFMWARRELPKPRPGFWSVRVLLIHDTLHVLSSPRPS